MSTGEGRLIDRMPAHRDTQVVLSGYVGMSQVDGTELRIYPEMNANHYYVLDLKSPLEMVVIPDDSHDRVRMVVESACEIETVTREWVAAAALARRARRRGPGTGTTGGADRVRDLLMAIARGMRLAGVAAIDAKAFRIAPPGAAHAWNRLLDAVGTSREADAADEVLARCTSR